MKEAKSKSAIQPVKPPLKPLLSKTAAKAGKHDYLSTACFHALHIQCRLKCKFCQQPCRCKCHAR